MHVFISVKVGRCCEMCLFFTFSNTNGENYVLVKIDKKYFDRRYLRLTDKCILLPLLEKCKCIKFASAQTIKYVFNDINIRINYECPHMLQLHRMDEYF